MSLSIHDRVFHNDHNHNFINAANAFFHFGGKHYHVVKENPHGYTVVRVNHTHRGIDKIKWLYLLVLPIIIFGIGLLVERCINEYRKLQRPAALIAINVHVHKRQQTPHGHHHNPIATQRAPQPRPPAPIINAQPQSSSIRSSHEQRQAQAARKVPQMTTPSAPAAVASTDPVIHGNRATILGYEGVDLLEQQEILDALKERGSSNHLPFLNDRILKMYKTSPAQNATPSAKAAQAPLAHTLAAMTPSPNRPEISIGLSPQQHAAAKSGATVTLTPTQTSVLKELRPEIFMSHQRSASVSALHNIPQREEEHKSANAEDSHSQPGMGYMSQGFRSVSGTNLFEKNCVFVDTVSDPSASKIRSVAQKFLTPKSNANAPQTIGEGVYAISEIDLKFAWDRLQTKMEELNRTTDKTLIYEDIQAVETTLLQKIHTGEFDTQQKGLPDFLVDLLIKLREEKVTEVKNFELFKYLYNYAANKLSPQSLVRG